MLIRVLRKQMYVRVNGKVELVEFKHGRSTNKNMRGQFSTARPELQKALESRDDFKKKFKIIATTEVADTEVLEEKVERRSDPLRVEANRKKEEERSKMSETEKALADEDAESPEATETEVTDDEPAESKETITVPRDEVSTVQAAKNYLMDKDDHLPASKLKNKTEVKAVAEEMGIVFEALE